MAKKKENPEEKLQVVEFEIKKRKIKAELINKTGNVCLVKVISDSMELLEKGKEVNITEKYLKTKID